MQYLSHMQGVQGLWHKISYVFGIYISVWAISCICIYIADV